MKGKDVDEAIGLLRKYNVHFLGNCEHFHIADASGNSAVVEYVDGRIVVIRNDHPWQVSTNYLLAEVQPVGATSGCRRYDAAYELLRKADGNISQDEAMNLLETISQSHTMWSVVYNLSTGKIQLALGRDYGQVHSFKLEMLSEQPM